jgi:hypothetical protein
MERWLAGMALVLVLGLLAGILVILLSLSQGITVRLESPSTPQEVHLVLTVPQAVEVVAGGEAQASLRTSLEGLPCPQCEEGTLLPTRWNPFTGEITWRCANCGYQLQEERAPGQ